MMRTCGAMPRITALHMATESFAVPKSDMKTIAGCAGERPAFSSCFELPHDQNDMPRRKIKRREECRPRNTFMQPPYYLRHPWIRRSLASSLPRQEAPPPRDSGYSEEKL